MFRNLPKNLLGIVNNKHFPKIFGDLLQKMAAAVKEREHLGTVLHLHVLCWCNQGCHRSVSFCRLLLEAATAFRWEQPGCIL